MLTKSGQEIKKGNNSKTIYTIGHSNLADYAFIKNLLDIGITLLVDVRSSPYSQYVPQFNRETLSKSLLDAGIDYQFLGHQLGGRPSDPSCYFSREIPEGKADYLHVVDYEAVMTKPFFLAGIEKLKGIVELECVAVMCSEEDPAHCHRHHLVGNYLMKQGYTLFHIRRDGMKINGKQIRPLPKATNIQQLDLFG